MPTITNSIPVNFATEPTTSYIATVSGISGGTLAIRSVNGGLPGPLVSASENGSYSFITRDAACEVLLFGNTGTVEITIVATIPIGGASAANQEAEITATNRAGTREYNMAAITRQAVGAASARVALPTLGVSRELYVMASTRCFFRSGDSSILAAAGTSHPLVADERFHLRIPAGHTHISYIRDGNISIVPVA